MTTRCRRARPVHRAGFYDPERTSTRPPAPGLLPLLTYGPLEELEEGQPMPSNQDAQDPATGSGHRGGSAVDVSVAEAEMRYHRDRLALYKARVHSGKPTSLTRLRELERTAARAEARARHVRGR